MENQKGGFFNGLKKMIFKDEPVSLQEQQPPVSAPATESLKAAAPVKTFDITITPAAKEDAAERAFKLIESINQPGVDFFEVWNAVEENGGGLKQAFNTLKYADKTLTKEKLLSSGNYYKTELQKALDGDIRKKQEEQQAIENKIRQSKETLTADISSIQEEIKKLQKDLTDKEAALSGLQTQLQPKLQEIEQKIQTGRQAIESVIDKMQALLTLAEKEL
ncbi:MAG: hypothetical protein QM640_05785 [Niabella sp.]